MVIVLYLACASFGMAALLFVRESGNGTTGLFLLIVAAAVVLAVGRLQYHEVEELRASFVRGVSERRLRTANNIRVRKATVSLRKARTLGEMFTAIELMLELGEFVYANVQVGRSGDSARIDEALAAECYVPSLRRAEIRNGVLCWTWHHTDFQPEDILGSAQYWSLRLPLSTDTAGWGYMNLYRDIDSAELRIDVNYICSLVRGEMALATERIMSNIRYAQRTVGAAGDRRRVRAAG